MFIQLTTFKDRNEGWKEFERVFQNPTLEQGREKSLKVGKLTRDLHKYFCLTFPIWLQVRSRFELISFTRNICWWSSCRWWWAMRLFNSLRLHYDFIVGDHNRLLLFVVRLKPSSQSFVQIFLCWWKLNIVLMELQKSFSPESHPEADDGSTFR